LRRSWGFLCGLRSDFLNQQRPQRIALGLRQPVANRHCTQSLIDDHPFGSIQVFRDPDNIQLELFAAPNSEPTHRMIRKYRRQAMKTADLNALDMLEAWYEDDPAMRVRANFPFHVATGNASSAVVYFEIEPGHYLGTHTDSAEEIVLILAGKVEASLGDETGQLSAGQAVLIPAMVPHGVRNVGDETARCVGFFSSATVESIFDRPVMPFGERKVGTPPVVNAA
jgi:quercetin dioxygenase-like cupin family protein